MTATVDNAIADLKRVNAELQLKLDERTAELSEALDQQVAAAEVLQVINSSPGDLAPVFDAMLDKAMRLCEAAFGFLHVVEGSALRIAALHNVPEEFAAHLETVMIRPDPASSFLGRCIEEKHAIHVLDNSLEQPYRGRAPLAVAAVELGGVRSQLHVPLLKDAAVVGVFTIFRQEVRPFSDNQIALLENFAAQAVIAMET